MVSFVLCWQPRPCCRPIECCRDPPVPQHHGTNPALNVAQEKKSKNPSARELLESSEGQLGPQVAFVCMKFSPGNVIRISQSKGLEKSNDLGADRSFCQKLSSWMAGNLSVTHSRPPPAACVPGGAAGPAGSQPHTAHRTVSGARASRAVALAPGSGLLQPAPGGTRLNRNC